MASGELDNLSGRRVLGVNLEGRQLQRRVWNLWVVAHQAWVTFQAKKCYEDKICLLLDRAGK